MVERLKKHDQKHTQTDKENVFGHFRCYNRQKQHPFDDLDVFLSIKGKWHDTSQHDDHTPLAWTNTNAPHNSGAKIHGRMLSVRSPRGYLRRFPTSFAIFVTLPTLRISLKFRQKHQNQTFPLSYRSISTMNNTRVISKPNVKSAKTSIL